MRGLHRVQKVLAVAVLSLMGACQLLTGTSDLRFDGETGGAGGSGGSGGNPNCMTCYAQARNVGVADPTTVDWCSGPDGIDQKRYNDFVSCMETNALCSTLCDGETTDHQFPLGSECVVCLFTYCSDALVDCLLEGGCINCPVAFALNLSRNALAEWCEGSQAIYQDFVDDCQCKPSLSGGCLQECTPPLSTCRKDRPSTDCVDCVLTVSCAGTCAADPFP
jgi:hypothetical protein